MGYVEFLRVRKSLTIFAIVLFCCAAFTAASAYYGIHFGHHHGSTYSISNDRPDTRTLADMNFQIPVGILFAIATFGTLVYATIVSASFNKENGRGGFAFTKPIARTRLALTYLAIDIAAILLSFAYALVLMFAVLALFGVAGKVYAEPGAAPLAFAGLGTSLMWYGLLQLVTAPRTAGGGLFIGLSWPFFLIALALYQVDAFGAPFHLLVTGVDFFNPLAYVEFNGHDDQISVTSLLGFSQSASIAITWGLATASCALAVVSWKRLEV